MVLPPDCWPKQLSEQDGARAVRRRASFKLCRTVLVCSSAVLTDDYVEGCKSKARRSWVARLQEASEKEAAEQQLHTAHRAVLAPERGGDLAVAESDAISQDLRNLTAIASRSGKQSAVTHKNNVTVIELARQHRSRGQQGLSADILAASASHGGLPEVGSGLEAAAGINRGGPASLDGSPEAPDGRSSAAVVDTTGCLAVGSIMTPPDLRAFKSRGGLGEVPPLRTIQRAMAAQAAGRRCKRARALYESPLKLRGPSESGGRLAENGIVSLVDSAANSTTTADAAAGADLRISSLNAIQLGLVFEQHFSGGHSALSCVVSRVLRDNGVSGLVAADTAVSEETLFGLFSGELQSAGKSEFGFQHAVRLFLCRCRE